MDLLLVEANVLTQDPIRPRAEAVAIKAGRIVAVGSNAEVLSHACPGTKVRRLEGTTLIPGFHDAHVHIWKVGHLLTTMQDVRGTLSLPALEAAIRSFAAALPEGRWYQGRGYNEAVLAEGRHPTRHDLDAAVPDRPAFLIRTCAHIAVANSAALRLAGITAGTEAPPGGAIDRDDAGEPTGILRETALGLVARHIPPPTRGDYGAMIRAANRHQLSLGITSATDPAVTPDLIEAYSDLEANGQLQVRTSVLAIRRPDGGSETLPLPQRQCHAMLRVDGVKFFADGGLSGATAALRVPYRHAPTQGILRFEEDELFALALEAHRVGFRIGTHAIGDAAIEQVLRVYERLARTLPGPRHRIEHLGLPDVDQLRRIAAAGIIAVPQAIFLKELGVNFRRYLPDDYLPRTYPLRAMLRAGVTVALSSDAPVVREDNPLVGMQAAILRRDSEGVALAPDQALTAEEALRAYTLGGAVACGRELETGSVTPGKWADLAVLSGDPLVTAAEELGTLKVRETYVAGVPVFAE